MKPIWHISRDLRFARQRFARDFNTILSYLWIYSVNFCLNSADMRKELVVAPIVWLSGCASDRNVLNQPKRAPVKSASSNIVRVKQILVVPTVSATDLGTVEDHSRHADDEAREETPGGDAEEESSENHVADDAGLPEPIAAIRALDEVAFPIDDAVVIPSLVDSVAVRAGRIRDRFDAIMATRSTPAGLPCPPAHVEVEGADRELQLMEARVWNSRSLDLQVRAADLSEFHRFAMHKAVVEQVGGLSFMTVEAYEITGGVSAVCASHLIATDFPGTTSLMMLLEAEVVVTEAVAKEVAVRMLSALKELHTYGVIHGAVDGSHLLSASGDEIVDVKLIGFEFAQLFVDPESGLHKLCDPAVAAPTADIDAAPWTLEGECTKSRRDDIYQLAELLMFLVAPEHVYSQLVSPQGELPPLPELASAKRSLLLPPHADPVWTEFHRAALSLHFSEAPDYDFWIARFSNTDSSS